MKTRITLSLLFFVSAIGFAAGYYLLKIHDCPASIFCYYLNIKAAALYYGAGALTIIFLTLAVVPQALKTWWKNFAFWYLPAALIIFVFYTGPKSGDFFSRSPQQIFSWIAAIYVVVSLAIIVICSAKAQSK